MDSRCMESGLFESYYRTSCVAAFTTHSIYALCFKILKKRLNVSVSQRRFISSAKVVGAVPNIISICTNTTAWISNHKSFSNLLARTWKITADPIPGVGAAGKMTAQWMQVGRMHIADFPLKAKSITSLRSGRLL